MWPLKTLTQYRLGQLLVYKKIRQAIGIRKTIVSGGGSLAPHLDDFFEILGVQVLNGWGLSEVRLLRELKAESCQWPSSMGLDKDAREANHYSLI